MGKIDGGLRSLFSKNIPGHWTPVETGGTALGVPDSEYCLVGGYQGWVEFKQCKSNAVVIRPQQVGWIERRVRMGGRVFVAVRRNDDLLLFHGEGVRALKVKGIAGAQKHLLGMWNSKWNWQHIAEILKS